MKPTKVAVNKSAERPDGIEIEVIEPENNLEQRVLSYLLTGFVNNAKNQGNLRIDLPGSFTIEYQREGSFVLYGGPQTPSVSGSQATYYQPQQPKAVLAIHAVGNRFDVVYGAVGTGQKPAEEPAEAAANAQ